MSRPISQAQPEWLALYIWIGSAWINRTEEGRDLELRVFLAREEADLVELSQKLLRLLQLAHLQIQLAQVLVRPAVVGFDLERARVEGERLVEIAELAVAVSQIVQRIGMLGIIADHVFEDRDGAFVVLCLDRLLGGRVAAVLGTRRGTRRPVAASDRVDGRRRKHQGGGDRGRGEARVEIEHHDSSNRAVIAGIQPCGKSYSRGRGLPRARAIRSRHNWVTRALATGARRGGYPALGRADRLGAMWSITRRDHPQFGTKGHRRTRIGSPA